MFCDKALQKTSNQRMNFQKLKIMLKIIGNNISQDYFPEYLSLRHVQNDKI